MKTVLPIAPGNRFGRYIVLRRAKSIRYAHCTHACWVCQCECGTERIILASNLRRGTTISCGCHRNEQLVRNRTTHKESHRNIPEYEAWNRMRDRCLNPATPCWKHYGGRGITICERWSSYRNFLADMGRRPTPQHSLDRWPNNNGNYEPGNCRWATIREQANNRRNNHLLTFKSKTQTISLWAQELGMSPFTLSTRIAEGWSVERTLTTPVPSRLKQERP